MFCSQAAARRAAEEARAAGAAAADSERRRQAAEKRAADTAAALAKSQKEADFLRSLNETLLSNQKEWQTRAAAAAADAAAKDATIADLNEQVRDLMVFIEAQRTLAEAGDGDLSGATLLPMPAQAGASSSRRGGRSARPRGK